MKWGNRMTNYDIYFLACEKANRQSKVMYIPPILSFNISYENMIYVIFSHDFAKAFWGEEIIEAEEGYFCLRCDKMNQPDVISWKYHLQQMVLEKEPIKYLEKFL